MSGDVDYTKSKLKEAYWNGVKKGRETVFLKRRGNAMADLAILQSIGNDEFPAYGKSGYHGHRTDAIKAEHEPHKEEPLVSVAPHKSSYGLHSTSHSTPQAAVRHYRHGLLARREQPVILVGLSDFSKIRPPECEGVGYFAIHFVAVLHHCESMTEWPMESARTTPIQHVTTVTFPGG